MLWLTVRNALLWILNLVSHKQNQKILLKPEVLCLKVYNLLTFSLQFHIYYSVSHCAPIKNFSKHFKTYINAVHIHDVYYFDQAIYIRMFCHLPFLETEFSRKTVFWTPFLSDLNSKRLPQEGKHSAGNEGTDEGCECLPESSGDWSKLWGKNEAVQLTFYVQTDQLVIKSEKCTIIMRICMNFCSSSTVIYLYGISTWQ